MKSIVSFLFICLLASFFLPVIARNNVKIASIGTAPPKLDMRQGPQKLVEQVISFWKGELEQVLPDQPDLIVLPEACDRPKGLVVEEQFKYFKVRKNQVLDYFRTVARNNHCNIAFGMKRQVNDGSWRNSCVILNREGMIVDIYDKNFPTIGEMETGIKAGSEAPLIHLDFGTVACAICFDLNFDELRQRYAKQKPDIILFPSMYHGGLIQAEWAYSCRAYFVGSMGSDKLLSEIRNPMGEIVATSTNYFHFIIHTVNLDYCLAHLDNNWAKLRALKEKYGDEVTIYDPGEIGAVMITSETDKASAKEMANFFDITLLDEYLNNSRNYRLKPGKLE
jgi:hypothetical protein